MSGIDNENNSAPEWVKSGIDYTHKEYSKQEARYRVTWN